MPTSFGKSSGLDGRHTDRTSFTYERRYNF